MTLTVYARDPSLRRIGEIDDYLSLTMPLRFNKVSAWELVVSAQSAAAAMLTLTAGIIVVRDGVTLLSGPVTSLTRTAQGSRETVTANGVDDTVWLERRLALPVPSGPPYTAAAYDLVNGAAETVMRSYVDRNLGPSAVAARQLVGLTLAADLGRGTAVKGSARFEPLLGFLADLALQGGDLGFRIVQVGTGLQFQVYAPVDKTATAVFSVEFGNLEGYTYTATVPQADYVYVGGQGEGSARTIDEGGTTALIDTYGRREQFRDRRDTNDPTTLALARAEALAETKPTNALALTPIDTAAVTFGRDYGLGDKVTVVIAGVPVRDVVREITYSLSLSGSERVQPVVGTPGATNPDIPDLFDSMAAADRRLTNLERR